MNLAVEPPAVPLERGKQYPNPLNPPYVGPSMIRLFGRILRKGGSNVGDTPKPPPEGEPSGLPISNNVCLKQEIGDTLYSFKVAGLGRR
jgi:hypothetical protein